MKKINKTLLALSCLAATTFGVAVTANMNRNIKPANAVIEGFSVYNLEELKRAFAYESYSSLYEGPILQSDITIDEPLYVGPNSKIALDLNGHTLNAQYEEDEKYSMIIVEGCFMFYGGYTENSIITGGRADKGGAIYVKEGGEASIENVLITGNYADQGGAIYCETDISIGSNTIIYGNKTLNGQNENNIYLKKDKSLKILGSYSNYIDKTHMGVTMEEPGVFASSDNINSNIRSMLFSDDDSYKVAMSTNKELKLQIPETVNMDVEHGKVISDPEYFVEGDTVTLKTIADDGYVIDELKVNNGEINLTKKDLNTYTFLATDSTSATAKFVKDYATKISWNKRPADSITQGEELDLTNVSIKAFMASEKTIIVDVTMDMITGFDSNKVGSQRITVTYQGKTTTFTLKVEPKPNKFPIGLVIGISVGVIALTTIIIVIAKRKKKKINK